MASSSFHAEIKKHGPYNMVKNHALHVDWFNPIPEDENPYIKAWWEWWPELSKTLNILRITGGEPLMHKSTWNLFEELKKNPRPHLELNLNSNLGVSTRIVEKFAKEVKHLLDTKSIKSFKLYTSIDSWGPRAEYMRTGLDVNLWERNMRTYLETTSGAITFMCTFNILSVTSFTLLLEKIMQWRKEYPGVNNRRIRFDTPYLKEPLQYDMHILPKLEFLPYFDKILTFIEDNKDEANKEKFSDLEYERFRRVRDYFASVQYDDKKISSGRKDFYNWFNEFDRRRNTTFLETFPEMKSFYDLCGTYNS
jgi:organic radical activating enzyme